MLVRGIELESDQHRDQLPDQHMRPPASGAGIIARIIATMVTRTSIAMTSTRTGIAISITP